MHSYKGNIDYRHLIIYNRFDVSSIIIIKSVILFSYHVAVIKQYEFVCLFVCVVFFVPLEKFSPIWMLSQIVSNRWANVE